MERSRRNWLKRLTVGLMTAVTLPGIDRKDIPMTEADRERRKHQEEMKRLDEEAAREVEELYSTKPKRVFLDGREYVIPANYFGPKQKNERDTYHADNDHGFGFILFLPDYGGFTKNNWQKGWFERSRIDVLQIRPVDKNAMIPYSLGGFHKIQPAGYGEPKARFENWKSALEQRPSFDMYGLKGFRQKNGTSGITWTGTRSNGEFFFFDSSLAPGEPVRPGIENPLCTTQYYSEKENLFIAYRYSQNHIAKWREIDDAIWAKLRGWRVK